MTSLESMTRQVARTLARHGARVAPTERAEWCKAMINEMDYLPRPASAIGWALGCIVVGYAERIRSMTRSIVAVSPWILALELMVCFAPLTFLFFAVVAAAARGAMTWQAGLLYASVALVGPLGLAVAFGRVVFKRRPLGRATSVLLAILAAWTFIAYSGQIFNNAGIAHPFDRWREFVLIALLPLLAVVHLIRITSTERASAIAS
jgi:hypothetical protein